MGARQANSAFFKNSSLNRPWKDFTPWFSQAEPGWMEAVER